MKNKFTFAAAIFVLIVSVLGCSFYNPLQSDAETSANSNKQFDSSNKSSSDSALGEEKIGVPECDEILEFFVRQTDSPDDNFVTKAAKGYALNKIRESFKRTIEEAKGDTAKMAKECREFKTQLDKYKAEEENKKK